MDRNHCGQRGIFCSGLLKSELWGQGVRYPDISDISVVLRETTLTISESIETDFRVQRETTLTISESIETGSPVETVATEMVSVVSFITAEITGSSGSLYLNPVPNDKF